MQRNYFTGLYLNPAGAADYDITGATSTVILLLAACSSAGGVRVGCGQALRPIGVIKAESEEIDAAPCGKVGLIRKYTFQVAGAAEKADDTVITTFKNYHGELKNVYLFDDSLDATESTDQIIVEQCLSGQVDIMMDDTSLKTPVFNVTITASYVGADTRHNMPNYATV